MIGSITPWNQFRSNELLEPHSVSPFLDWYHATPAGQVYHRVSWKVDGSASDAAITTLYLRLLSHLLVSRLPDEAIAGVFDSLVQAYQDLPEAKNVPVARTDARSAQVFRSILAARIPAAPSRRVTDITEY